MNQRSGNRTKQRIPCTFSVDQVEYEGRIVDLSPAGAFVEAEVDAIPPSGSEVVIRLTAGRTDMILQGVVARRHLLALLVGTSVGRGFGVRLEDPPAEYLQGLETLQLQGQSRDVRDFWGIDRSDRLARREQWNPGASLHLRGRDRNPVGVPPPLSAMIVDEGELNDVYALLEGLGARPARVLGPSVFEGWSKAPRVFVAAARSALSIRVPTNAELEGVVTIAVAESQSHSLCTLMRRLGYQYVVRRPVHPEALRLLLMRALHREPDQRECPRYPSGHPVQCRIGWRRWNAWALEISSTGCRLMTPSDIEPGSQLRICFPRSSTGSPVLRLRGRVVRCESHDNGAGSRGASVGVEFDVPGPTMGGRLARLIARQTIGPAVLPRDVSAGALRPFVSVARPQRDGADAEPDVEPLPDQEREERRYAQRGALRHEIVAFDQPSEQVMHVLFGCDLSPGGIRVEQHPSIALGDRLTLAIYDASCSQPLIVEAEVIRDDGDRGAAMRFVDSSDDVVAQLERVVAELPSVEAGGASEDEEAERVVIAQILTRRVVA